MIDDTGPLRLPRFIGVVHLAALPGAPRFDGHVGRAVDAAVRDARALVEGGCDAVLVENFGDAPFYPGAVPAVTVSAVTACALAVRSAVPDVALGINVLRNDAAAALGIAAVVGASFVRVNVHGGARVTDQGLLEGRAHETLRLRRALGLEGVALFCDVDVKHSAGFRPLLDEAAELADRGLADALLLTGRATGDAPSTADLESLAQAVGAPLYVASGVTALNASAYGRAHGFIVGSSLRASGRAGDPVSVELVATLANALPTRPRAATPPP